MNLFSFFHLAVVYIEHCPQQGSGTDIVILSLGLNGVGKKAQRPGAVNLLIAKAIHLRDFSNLTIENFLIISVYRNHGFPAVHLIIERVIIGNCGLEHSCIPRFQFQDRFGQRCRRMMRVIQDVAIHFDFVHQITLLRKITWTVPRPAKSIVTSSSQTRNSANLFSPSFSR